MTIEQLRATSRYSEVVFFDEVYNGCVAEFAALVREQNGNAPRPLPETWEGGRLFPAGKQDWDLLVEAVGEQQRVVDELIVAFETWQNAS